MTGIYYSDLFVINGKGCLVMGSGKSDGCRNYTGDDTEEIGLDSIRLELDGKNLYGYSDPTMGKIEFPKSQMANCKIHYLIYMSNIEETKNTRIQEIDKEAFILLCEPYVTHDVEDTKSRLKEFEQFVVNSNVICIVVPWCQTVEEKGLLITDFIK